MWNNEYKHRLDPVHRTGGQIVNPEDIVEGDEKHTHDGEPVVDWKNLYNLQGEATLKVSEERNRLEESLAKVKFRRDKWMREAQIRREEYISLHDSILCASQLTSHLNLLKNSLGIKERILIKERDQALHDLSEERESHEKTKKNLLSSEHQFGICKNNHNDLIHQNIAMRECLEYWVSCFRLDKKDGYRVLGVEINEQGLNMIQKALEVK